MSRPQCTPYNLTSQSYRRTTTHGYLRLKGIGRFRIRIIFPLLVYNNIIYECNMESNFMLQIQRKKAFPYYSNLNKTHKETGLEVSIVFHSISLEGENVA